jgi:hypothetical protein
MAVNRESKAGKANRGHPYKAAKAGRSVGGRNLRARSTTAPPRAASSDSRSQGPLEQALYELQATVDALRERIEAREASQVAAAAFADELQELLGGEAPDPQAVRRAARLALAEQAWERRLGTLLETRDVVDLLAVSRQRVSAMIKDHRLIALPQDGRMRFPAWQFAGTDARDRTCLGAAHELLIDVGGVSPWSAASWFQAPHPELDQFTPVDWLRDKQDRAKVVLAAERDAARAAK